MVCAQLRGTLSTPSIVKTPQDLLPMLKPPPQLQPSPVNTPSDSGWMCCLGQSRIHETSAEVAATLPLPQIQGEALALPHHTGAACMSVGTPG